MHWKKQESGVSEKTMKENRFLWNALLRDKEITLTPLKSLTVQDYITYCLYTGVKTLAL